MLKNKLNTSYTNVEGQVYPNVLEYHFQSGEDFAVGKVIASSHDSDTDAYGYGQGFYIYEDEENPDIGYRIYREYKNANDCDEQKNADYIQKLQSIQNNVLLTTFPYGVVTLDKRIVGQIIPIYHNCVSLRQYVKEHGWECEDIYLECLNILKELCANGAYYYDMNADNFLITNDGIKLIDFEDHQMEFDHAFSPKQERVIHNFRIMLMILSRSQIKEKYANFINANSFAELEAILKSGKQK